MLQSDVDKLRGRYGEVLEKHFDEDSFSENLSIWLVVAACVNRQIALVSAMPPLFKDRNIYALMPLVRLQLEGAIRLHSLFIVEDPSALADYFLIKGKEIKSYKNGKFKESLSDSALAKSLGESLTGRLVTNAMTKDGKSALQYMYRMLCGWVHFSNQHFINLTQEGEERDDGIPNIDLNIGDYKNQGYDGHYEMLTAVIPFIHEVTLLLVDELIDSRFGESNTLH